MSVFISGVELSRRFYQEAVRPILDASFPGLLHSAALLGRGSEVLGFDDEMSGDHNWEPRVLLFLHKEDHARHHDGLEGILRREVPPLFRGRRTDFGIHTLHAYFRENLNVDIDSDVGVQDWLTLPEPQLCTVTAGAVYHDEVGLQAVRDRFAYYPQDVWLYLLIAGWWRVHPEANLVGRTGATGDELGSALIGSQLVLDLMRLCFLMERQYAPYSKWFGAAFSGLKCAADMAPILRRVLRADTWQVREKVLMAAYEKVAAMHNALHITAPVPTEVCRLWERPYRVLWGDFPGALRTEIRDTDVLRIAGRWPAGGIDRLKDLPLAPRNRAALLHLFE